MSRARVLLLVPALVLLFGSSLALGSRTAASATGAITGGGPYKLVITNTGTTSIKCFQVFAADGVAVSSITPPAGWQTAVDPGDPKHFLGFNLAGLGPGATAEFTFVTDAPYPVNGGAALHVSDDCQSDTVIEIAGPPPCDCVALTARIVASSIKFTNPGEIGGMHLEFDVAWTMTCAVGAGECQGSITLVAPKRGKVFSSAFKKPGATITCGGECAATTKGTQHFVLIGNRGLGGDRRGKKVAGIGIAVKRTCQGKPLGGGGFVLIFNRSTALVDKKKSKLS